MDAASLPGFRDFYPADLALRRHIFAVWREVARRYGFVEYDGPPLEALELYTRKSGEEIVGQLYRFTDQGGREVALRPEMTPTLARMVAARARGMAKPIKWFSIPQLFRYERPQKGRLREHFQLNLDIVGEAGVAADAEVVAAAVDILRAFGLTERDFVARVSDRRLISAILEGLGVPPDRAESAFAAMDKIGRESEEWIIERLLEAGASAEASERLLGLGGRSVDELAGEFGAVDAVRESAARMERFFAYMQAFGLAEYVVFDARLVRGLAYYTGIVFELWDRRGELRAVCGGGRYDDLLAALGGVDLPAAGFGMGDVVLARLLRDRGLAPEVEGAVDEYVVCVTEDQRPLALQLVHQLRERGRRVAYDFAGRSVARQFKAAHQVGARRAIVVGPEEAAAGEIIVRSMDTGGERRIPLPELLGGEE